MPVDTTPLANDSANSGLEIRASRPITIVETFCSFASDPIARPILKTTSFDKVSPAIPLISFALKIVSFFLL